MTTHHKVKDNQPTRIQFSSQCEREARILEYCKSGNQLRLRHLVSSALASYYAPQALEHSGASPQEIGEAAWNSIQQLYIQMMALQSKYADPLQEYFDSLPCGFFPFPIPPHSSDEIANLGTPISIARSVSPTPAPGRESGSSAASPSENRSEFDPLPMSQDKEQMLDRMFGFNNLFLEDDDENEED